MTVIKKFSAFLTEHNHPHRRVRDELIGLSVNVQNVCLEVFVAGDPENNYFEILSNHPIAIPQNKTEQVIDLINKINLRSPLGCFRLDLESQCVNFRISTFYDVNYIDEDLFKELLDAVSGIMSIWFSAFSRLAYSDITADEAIEIVRSDFDDDDDDDDESILHNRISPSNN